MSQKINPYWYPKEYFYVQVCFARKFSEITGMMFEDSLLTKTGLHWRVGGASYKDNKKTEEWVQAFDPHLNNEELTDKFFDVFIRRSDSFFDPKHNEFGAFSYWYNPENQKVKLHYENLFKGEKSPLSIDFFDDRIADLKKMFSDIKAKCPMAVEVTGSSWLYQLPAYKRLFPKMFINNLRNVTYEEIIFSSDSLWGQFLDSKGNIKKDLEIQFVDSIEKASSLEELLDSFPLYPMCSSAPIQCFYSHYGV